MRYSLAQASGAKTQDLWSLGSTPRRTRGGGRLKRRRVREAVPILVWTLHNALNLLSINITGREAGCFIEE